MRTFVLSLSLIALMIACKDELDITNPNEPTPASATTKRGIIALAQGAVYINGFQGSKFGGDYFTGVLGMHDQMGDIISSDVVFHQLSCPDKITLDDGGTLESINTEGQKAYLESLNIPTSQANAMFYEWAFMYAMNGTLNQVLAIVDDAGMNSNENSTIKAWAYFWKGFAYSRIGSMYHAGIITNNAGEINNHYVSREEILQEAEDNFKKAQDHLQSINNIVNYEEILNSLIPSPVKRGKGYPVTIDEWLANINTLRARNLLANTSTSGGDASFWNKIEAFTSSGIKSMDNTFTIRTDDFGNLLGTFLSATVVGSASAGGGVYKVSERLIQEFESADRRFLNNFESIDMWAPAQDRGTAINTRYILLDKGKGIDGVMSYCNSDIGEQEIYIAGSYEENQLMRAEALIHLNQVDEALALMDEIRIFQGAGLAPLAGSGLTAEAAIEILRRERRTALAFRGLSFYDARRWGVLENGRTEAVVIDFSAHVNSNAMIDYGYKEYWDVPVAEWYYNTPSADSAPIANPD